MRRQVATAAAVTMLGSVLCAGPAHAAGPGYTSSYKTIPGHGGTPLKALVYQPKGRGPFPLIVMPASWSLFHAEYAGAAAKLASSGYAVVAYTSRGFWDSAGKIEVAGRPDVGDVSKVIDWAVKNARADEKRVGAAGISYGAGIPLIASAFDRRIRAVSAMSGWASLPDSLYLNETVSEQAAAMLLSVGHATGRPGKDLLEVQDGYLKDRFGNALSLASVRGAAAYVKRINANKPALLLSGGWQDGIFPPAQNVDFFNRLKVPKRLMYQAGDHGTPDGLGAVGLPNDAWSATKSWFDHYLKGKKNGVADKGSVSLKANNGGGWKHFANWRTQAGETRRYHLSKGERLGSRGGSWKKTLTTGRGTVADSGVVEATGAGAQAGLHWTIRPAQVDRENGLVFRGPKLGRATTVSGFPVFRTTITPSARNTSLFAYLYDEAPDGRAELVTHIPYSLRDATPGKARKLDLRLQPIRWKLAAGHRLTLVIDTADIRYRNAGKPGAEITFSSSPSRPSSLTVPVG
ncbi:CocE/NonD family hydrolase [Actinocorallia sp. B10E7]|uniref:CocE/NonD family hydrolase n=1 Tax=Actinocorallia sp. B10E7 TaxID=3153558 RepID=UPI00325E8F79